MTIFAGAFCLDVQSKLPQVLKDSLVKHLRQSDNELGHRSEFDNGRLLLAKWDSGAFAEPAWHQGEDGAVCAMAGDAILVESGAPMHRDQQLRRLAPSSLPLDEVLLTRCRGSFALVSYAPVEETLWLTTDAIGLRSVYYLIQDGILIFATALRILEAIPEIRKKLSPVGMAELSAFSFPLAEHTPYEGIKTLRECEILQAGSAGVKLRRYYDWGSQEAAAQTAEQAAVELYTIFSEAVRLRAGSDSRVYSFLSGGMDSRAIVGTLIGMGREVEALNFSSTDSQDQRYAQLLAAESQPHCRLHCLPGGDYPNFSFLALAAKTDLERREAIAVDRPRFIWSGDGGSVGLGHVYMDERVAALAENGEFETAVKYFLQLNKIALPSGVLTRAARKCLPQTLADNVLKEVNRYPREDLVRRIYLFLLFNDQRRHLFKHFETIDQHGLELLTPFYDGQFLKAVAATPARWGLLHRLYALWFESLPAFVRKTPWQTYPGHVACPLPSDKQASYQWAGDATVPTEPFDLRRTLALELFGAFRNGMLPGTFSRSRVWMAALMHALGLRDCRHILSVMQVYQRYDLIARSSGRSPS